MHHIISIENMELRQLKYFLKLAETLNFSSAAKELFITQSTLSQQILNLEREFDQPLFVRNSHEVQLTEAGRLLMPHAQESINAAENCLTLVQELKHMLVGELNVGVTFSFSNIMAETMAEFLKKYPNVKLNVCYDSMAVLMEKLQHHDLDLVLAFKPLKTDNRIDSEVLFHTHASAIVNEFHPLARQSKVTLEELQKYGLALPAIGLQARNAFEKVIEGNDITFKIKSEINNVNLLFKLVKQTNYVTVLAASTVIGESGVCAIPIDLPEADMEGCIHTMKNGYTKNAAREFINMLHPPATLWKEITLPNG